MGWRRIPNNPAWVFDDTEGVKTRGDNQVYKKVRRIYDDENINRGEMNANYYNAKVGVLGAQPNSYYENLPIHGLVPWSPIVASGGTEYIVERNGVWYREHSFFSGSGSFTVTDLGNNDGVITITCVGGGGGGNATPSSSLYGGSGGGGGGALIDAKYVVTKEASYLIEVGAAGGGGYSTGGNGGTSRVLAPQGGYIVQAGGGQGAQGTTYPGYGGSAGKDMSVFFNDGEGGLYYGGRGGESGQVIQYAYNSYYYQAATNGQSVNGYAGGLPGYGFASYNPDPYTYPSYYGAGGGGGGASAYGEGLSGVNSNGTISNQTDQTYGGGGGGGNGSQDFGRPGDRGVVRISYPIEEPLS
jgi:hypothetical protein